MKRKMITMLLVSMSLSVSGVPVYAVDTAFSAVENSVEDTGTVTAEDGQVVISAEELEEKIQVSTDTKTGTQTTLPTSEILKENSPLKETKGSIVIKLTDGASGTKKSGIQFTVTQVADIVDGEYVLKAGLTQSGFDINNLKTSAQLETAASSLVKQTKTLNLTKQTVKTDANGMATISDMPVGVYLISAKDVSTFDTITPSLVAIPSFNETKKEMVYDLTVQPKHTPKPKKSTTPGKSTKTVHKTGYDSPMWLYFGGAGVLGAALAFVNRKKKKEAK